MRTDTQSRARINNNDLSLTLCNKLLTSRDITMLPDVLREAKLRSIQFNFARHRPLSAICVRGAPGRKQKTDARFIPKMSVINFRTRGGESEVVGDVKAELPGAARNADICA